MKTRFLVDKHLYEDYTDNDIFHIEVFDNYKIIFCNRIMYKDYDIEGKIFIKVLWESMQKDHGYFPVFHIARINIFKPEYITGYNEDKKFTKEELELFIKIVSSNWNEILNDFNSSFCDCKQTPWFKPLDIIMPDYSKLETED